VSILPGNLLERVIESAKNAPEPVTEVTVAVLDAAREYGGESLATAALARLIRAILVSVSHSHTGLIKVVSAPSDLQAILQFLEEPAVIEELSRIDPLARSRVRGIFRKAELYEAEGGCVSADEAARLVGVSRQAIHAARLRKDVFALPRGQDGWTYPVWQFEGGHYLEGLASVLQALNNDGPFVQASFLLSKHALLDSETPFACLKKGQLDLVLKAAEAFGVHGGS
jgi:hypothetical protein